MLEALLAREPSHTQAHLILGGIAWKDDRIRDATRHALDAARELPNDPNLICDIAAALIQVGEIVAAQSCIANPILANATTGAVVMRLAGLHQTLDLHAEALALFDRAESLGVPIAELRRHRAIELAFNGKTERAENDLEACVRSDPVAGRAALMLARLHRQTQTHNHLASIEQRIRTAVIGSEDHAAYEFARYKELEDLGRFDDAWHALAAGNAIMHRRLRHDSADERRRTEQFLARCTREFLRPVPVDRTGPQPIFIIGLPRSGTTVLDRMLANHSKIVAAGERSDFGKQLCWSADHHADLLPDARMLEKLPHLDFAEMGHRYLAQTQWRARGADYFIDKLPAHWIVAGLIRKALPHARILHLTREPMDVCFSNFRALFGSSYPYSYDLRSLAAHYRCYRQTMDHWHATMPGQILDVPYHDLVHDNEATARSVLAFCGLDYEAQCADLMSNTAPVATLSMIQVREPIHARSFDEWRRYETQLVPLRALVESGEPFNRP